MFHYLFTNDLRITNLESVLKEAARCFKEDCVPSASEDKNANNNMNTLGFYFNLTTDSNCTKEAASGNVRKVVLNFIKKFQFPNPRTSASMNDCIDDGILLAPMRTILKVLYIMSMVDKDQAYLTKKEALDYIFFNEAVAKNPSANIIDLTNIILSSRKDEPDDTIPSDETLEQEGKYWKHCSRQIREMIKILCWSGCVMETDNGGIKLKDDNLTRDNKADIFEIITCTDYWIPDKNKSFDDNKSSYQAYMDIAGVHEQQVDPEILDEDENQTAFAEWMKQLIIPYGETNSGSHYSEQTIGTYISDIKYHKIVLMDEERTLFATKDTDIIDAVLERPDVGANRAVAIRKYRQFVMEQHLFEKQMLTFKTGYKSSFALNRIVFGAPGTGKSYTINKELKVLLGDDNEADYERVTFHPDYSYANFVGTYKPVPCIDSDGNETITYTYVPGPFMRVYVEAMKNCREEVIRPFLLVIEEINRANVAAVFGDVFQLLDRNDDNISEYPIQASEDIKKYLAKELGGLPDDYCKIRIPDNMFIWATMNSADQGVFPMDTAFKRRWDFTYLGIDDSDKDIRGKYVFLADDKSQKVEWNRLRKAINQFLSDNKINEDKQLGPYFIARSIVVPAKGDEIERERFIDTFKNKVIMYLFEDAGKRIQSRLFEGCFESSNRYSEICKEFDAKGVGIFNHEIVLALGLENQSEEDSNEND